MATSAEQRFEALGRALVKADARVASPETERAAGNRFGASGLKVDGKLFAMVARGQVVFKLPAARVDALVEAGAGERFDPGHGRLMKEWLALPPDAQVSWTALGKEALAFVGKTAGAAAKTAARAGAKAGTKAGSGAAARVKQR